MKILMDSRFPVVLQFRKQKAYPFKIGTLVSVFSTRNNRWFHDGKVVDIDSETKACIVHYKFTEVGRVEKRVDFDELDHFIKVRDTSTGSKDKKEGRLNNYVLHEVNFFTLVKT
eukprot:UN31281